MTKIHRLFEHMLQREGSDLHLLQGQKPKMRIHGELQVLDAEPVLDDTVMRGLLREICLDEQWNRFVQTRDLDFAYEYQDKARFRANYYFQQHGLGAVFRTIPSRVLSLDELGLPPVVRTFARQRSGLILVTGPTGSGKSTTLAALLDDINSRESRYILTVEEPIEFVHMDKRSVFCQREVGRDVASFAEAIRSSSRLDCDVVLVGEMRDYETISQAISAASMGKLVLGTLHTNSAVKTVDRIIDAFPSDEQDKARNMLSDALYGVIAQILLRRADGRGRIAAHEILINTQGMASSIREGNTSNIRNIIQSGKTSGMQLMDDAIDGLLRSEQISREEAYMKAQNKERFQPNPGNSIGEETILGGESEGR